MAASIKLISPAGGSVTLSAPLTTDNLSYDIGGGVSANGMNVGGNANIVGTLTTAGYANLYSTVSVGSLVAKVNASITQAYVAWGNTTNTYAQIGGYREDASNGRFEIYTLQNGTLTEQIRVANTGNVGIGTSNTDTFKLNVNGSANIAGTLTVGGVAIASGGTFNYVKVFTSGTTWTVPAGVTRVRAIVVAGGGGSGFYSCGGNGPNMPGGAGGYAQGVYNVTPGSTITVTVGAAGVSQSAGNGTAGGSSSFGSFASATGGSGGYFVYGPNIGYAGANGTATGGTTLNTNAAAVTSANRIYPWEQSYASYGLGAAAMATTVGAGIVVVEYLQ